jgi:hypothetical protein
MTLCSDSRGTRDSTDLGYRTNSAVAAVSANALVKVSILIPALPYHCYIAICLAMVSISLSALRFSLASILSRYILSPSSNPLCSYRCGSIYQANNDVNHHAPNPMITPNTVPNIRPVRYAMSICPRYANRVRDFSLRYIALRTVGEYVVEMFPRP